MSVPFLILLPDSKVACGRCGKEYEQYPAACMHARLCKWTMSKERLSALKMVARGTIDVSPVEGRGFRKRVWV